MSACTGANRRRKIGLGIGGKESGAGAHRDKVLIKDRGEVSRNKDRYQSISFAGGRRIQSKEPIAVDRHGICLEWRKWELI